MNRRGFITGLVSLIAAPAIVRATSLMAISPVPPLVLAFDTAVGPERNAISLFKITGYGVDGKPVTEMVEIELGDGPGKYTAQTFRYISSITLQVPGNGATSVGMTDRARIAERYPTLR